MRQTDGLIDVGGSRKAVGGRKRSDFMANEMEMVTEVEIVKFGDNRMLEQFCIFADIFLLDFGKQIFAMENAGRSTAESAE